MKFKKWLKRQDEMSLDYLRINPKTMSRQIISNPSAATALDTKLVPHAGEYKMLSSNKLKNCLESKFARINVPVQIIMDTKQTPEEKIPDPSSIKIIIKDRGGDPMTCWMILHRIGHAGLGYKVRNEISSMLYKWFKEYVKHYPEWGSYSASDKKMKDAYDDWISVESADVRFPLSKFLMFKSARKTASAIEQWASGSVHKKRWGYPPQHGEDIPFRNPEYYSSLEPKSYALDEEFYHELIAEYLWNGRIRVNEDSKDTFVQEHPGYITKMFDEISKIIHQNILSLKGQVLDGDT